MANLTPNSLPWKKLVELHRGRNPYHTQQRIESEVRDFLRRAYNLGPDLRAPEDGGLAGLKVNNAADAFLLAIRNDTDITKLYVKERT